MVIFWTSESLRVGKNKPVICMTEVKQTRVSGNPERRPQAGRDGKSGVDFNVLHRLQRLQPSAVCPAVELQRARSLRKILTHS